MPGNNSTITLLEIIDDAETLGDVAPTLATGGRSQAPAISIANDVMLALINGGPRGQRYNWKWNRFNVPAFLTISFQQDYFIPGLVNLGWLESAWASNVNQTSVPKQNTPLEVHKDLEVTYAQTGYPAKCCWIPADQMMTGTWGNAPLGPTPGNPSGNTAGFGINPGGLQNPGPNVIYTNPLGILQTPTNATTCITDPNGNLWVLTTFGTCGSTQPSWPTNPVYPVYGSSNTGVVTTTVQDGTCVWTAINSKGQGIRLSPIPPQTGIVWLIQPLGQLRAPRITAVGQLLNPIPDDYISYFKQGFFAECYRRSPDPKIRAKYQLERQMWLESLEKAVWQADKELDDYGFYPGDQIMDQGWSYSPITPAMPYGPWS